MGEVWRRLGFSPKFWTRKSIPSQRQNSLEEVGPLVGALEDLRECAVINYHHGAFGADQMHVVEELKRTFGAAVRDPSPRLVTHNVFGVPDDVLSFWPTERTVCVLGAWCAAQYRASSPRRSPSPHVLGNPQDDKKFRLPTVEERLDARRALGVDDTRVTLRIGSPISEKWSPTYVRLARQLRDLGQILVVLGAPSALEGALQPFSNVRVLGRTPDDDEVRRLYWAADLLAHDAQRGESFGNVIVEALLSGLPVVYRARPLRDNTPWEFRDIGGFSYAVSAGTFVNQAVVPRVNEAVDRDSVLNRYGMQATAVKLAGILSGADVPRTDLPVADRALVQVRHNRVAGAVKGWRLRSAAGDG